MTRKESKRAVAVRRVKCAHRNHSAAAIMSNEEAEFHAKYITSGEVTRLAKTSPSTVLLARRNGTLPGAVRCNCGYVWDRELIKPHLENFIQHIRRSNHVRAARMGWDAANNKPIPL